MRELSADEAALVRAVTAAPEDDLPRLVYADWLEEHGGEAQAARAEFIRLQIAVGRVPWDTPTDPPPTPRERELLRAFNRRDIPGGWRTDHPQLPGVSLFGNRYARGFLWEATASAAPKFLSAAPVLFSRVPVTHLLVQSLTPKTAAKLAASPHLARIRRLSPPVATWTDETLAPVAGSPYLTGFTTLALGWCRLVTPPVIRSLLTNPALRHIATVDLERVGLGVAEVAALAAAPFAPRLEVINLAGCRVGTGGLLPLLTSTALRSLRRIDLRDNAIDDGAVAPLAAADWPRLEMLRLSENRLSGRAAADLRAVFGDRVSV